MNIPYDNWQFWVVTLFALWAGYTVVRPFLPKRGRHGNDDATACPHCASGSAGSKKAKKTKLTVDGHKR